ncbi:MULTISPECIES: UrcA family protein [unclassified Novosphingobium]|uniref:UrcA family protein n=1 Tax=unclassified Novosphingobium TaxID=2644732 RepID=UPI00146BD10E|nr:MULTISPECIES: UrcA family protein [unclassified Novosphingobium]NMN04868.1 UrcA family protein [Novosphingobium sp. SG919]NMN85138.1 UrcA family protein [Novosphingobium sp. SG916]
MMNSQGLYRFRQHSTPMLFATLAVLSGWAVPSSAHTDPFGERVEIKVHRPTTPVRSDAMARHNIVRLGKAAMQACGASDQSLAQVQAAVRRSPCWHQAMDSAVRQVGDTQLSAWWAAHR